MAKCCDFSHVIANVKELQSKQERKADRIKSEIDKILNLPDELFLKEENQVKLKKLNDGMVLLAREVLHEARPRSKYFEKHYDVQEAKLEEKQCYHCKCIFAIDYKWLNYFTKNFDEDWARCICPYCGTTIEWCI